jgi:hypothetical protein
VNVSDYTASRSDASGGRPQTRDTQMTRTFEHSSAALTGLASLFMAALPFVALAFVGFNAGQF